MVEVRINKNNSEEYLLLIIDECFRNNGINLTKEAIAVVSIFFYKRMMLFGNYIGIKKRNNFSDEELDKGFKELLNKKIIEKTISQSLEKPAYILTRIGKNIMIQVDEKMR